MKLTKFAIATLLAMSCTDAKAAGPFDKKADVMKLVVAVDTDTAALEAAKEKVKKTDKAIADLAWDDSAAAESEEKCKDAEAIKDDEDAKKECKEYADGKTKKEELDKAKETEDKEVADSKTKADKSTEDLQKLNPGLEPATLDTIRASFTGDSFDFLITEVDESSTAAMFTAFDAKLATQMTNWDTVKSLDKAEVEKDEADTKKLYEERVKADDMANKAVEDLKASLLATSSKDWDDKALSTDQKGYLKVAIAQYQLNAIKANIAQAISLAPIDKASFDYEKYVKDMKALVATNKGDLENVLNGNSSASDGNNTYLYIGIGLVIVVIVSVVGYKKYSKKDD